MGGQCRQKGGATAAVVDAQKKSPAEAGHQGELSMGKVSLEGAEYLSKLHLSAAPQKPC
jgi:hypothetical protein